MAALAPPAGLEPATHGLTVHCSNQLSYGGMFFPGANIKYFSFQRKTLMKIFFSIFFDRLLRVKPI